MKSLVPNHPLWPSDGLTPVNDAHQMTLRVSKTQVSPVALFDDANLVQTMELGRCCGRHDGFRVDQWYSLGFEQQIRLAK